MLDPFDTLGIAPSFEIDLGVAERRYRDLSRVLHPDKHVGGSAAERRMALGKAVEVNEAWRVLRDPIQRAEALFRRHGMAVSQESAPPAPAEFLMDMMEHREALSEAKVEKDRGAIERLSVLIRTSERAVLERLAQGFDGSSVGSENLPNLLPLLGELRYYRRFLEEVSAIEDET